MMTTRTTSTCALAALTTLTAVAALTGCGHYAGTKTSAPSLSTVAAHPTPSVPTQAGTPSSGATEQGGSQDGQQGGSASGGSASGSASAPAAGGVTYKADVWAAFVSPSGKNMCELDTKPDSVSCRLSPALQQQYGGSMVQLGSFGTRVWTADYGQNADGSGSTWAFTGSSVPPMSGFDNDYVLPYGSSITGGSVTCSSSTNGFTCTNGSSSFTVNAESLTMN